VTVRTLIRRSLRFYWRTHLGVVLGAAVSATILVGALVVGDSVRASLRGMALARLGNVVLAMAPQDRFFRAALADNLVARYPFGWGRFSREGGAAAGGRSGPPHNGGTEPHPKAALPGGSGTETVPPPQAAPAGVISEQEERTVTRAQLGWPPIIAPVLQLRGLAASSDGTARANRVQVLGIDGRFWALGGAWNLFKEPGEDSVVLNDHLATQLGVQVGDDVVIRVEEPSLLPRDAPLSDDTNTAVALRLTVAAIATDSDFGRFSLQANQVPPYNAYLLLARLQREAKQPGRANLLLVGGGHPMLVNPSGLQEAIHSCWSLADADLELRELPMVQRIELRSRRIFLDPPVEVVAKKIRNPVGVLTYFVNEFRVDDRSAPYAMATAIGHLTHLPVTEGSSTGMDLQESSLEDGGTSINTELAKDLHAKLGDDLTLTYYVLGAMRKLEARRTTFRIAAIVPIEGIAADRELMPAFPGISEAESCQDWRPGIPIDLKKIRKLDEAYWAKYRGTPKVFITLPKAREIWGNRFGSLTAIRWSAWYDTMGQLGAIDYELRSRLDPKSLGLVFQPVREQAMAASGQAMDFGQLFLGFSFFLIAAALLLMGLLFAFGIEQRTEEVGTLLALGFPPKTVRRLLLGEGAALAVLGSVLGAACGTLYTRLVLRGLSTVWQGAVAGASLQFHAELSTVAMGAGASILVAMLAMWLVLRRQARRPARELLAGPEELAMAPVVGGRGRGRLSLWIAAAALTGGLVLVGLALARGDRGAAGAFFGAGGLLLLSGLSASHALLSRLSALQSSSTFLSPRPRLTLRSLGVRNAARRRGRSLAVIGLLACGSFLVVAVGANRHDPAADAHLRSSGTGGFALYGESALPVYRDLNSPEGRKAFGLNAKTMEGVSIVQLRLHEGDDASCLNLNRAQRSRLLGVRPEDLESRNAFGFERLPAGGTGWPVLRSGADRHESVPAIGDDNTVTWGLGKALGSLIPYADEAGKEVPLQIAGVIGNSILQGSLLIAEDRLTALFPSESGYRVFLIDAPPDRVEAVSKELSRALRDIGLELTPAARRLAEFNAVENTYLSIFQALGGLGLLLGSVGLGIVVLRNVLERRGELALLRAVGFPKRSIQWLILVEHWGLVALGLACGVAAAAVAVLPALRSPGAGVPYLFLIYTLAAVAASGLLWTWLAALVALRGPLLAALRNE